MHKLTLSAITAILSMPPHMATMPIGLTRDQLTYMTPHSRGKSGKTSSSRSNAAQLKRAAKKRNNIRKHN